MDAIPGTYLPPATGAADNYSIILIVFRRVEALLSQSVGACRQ